MLARDKIKLIFLILLILSAFIFIAGFFHKNQQMQASASALPEGGLSVKALVVKLSQSEYDSISKSGLENPSAEDFRTLVIGMDIAGLDQTKDKTVKCPDIGDIMQKLSSKLVWSTHSSGTDNGMDSVISYNNTLLLYTKGISDTDLKLKLKGLKIEVAYTDLHGKKIEKSFDVSDILQFV